MEGQHGQERDGTIKTPTHDAHHGAVNIFSASQSGGRKPEGDRSDCDYPLNSSKNVMRT